MKKKLKNLLVTSLTMPSVAAFGSKVFGNGVPIFMLHRFESDSHSCSGTPPSHLRHCLHYLSENNFTFISLTELLTALSDAKPLPPKSVVFTIDDGYADQIEVAAPIFLEFNCPVTIFLITGMLDGKLWPWDAKVSHLINYTEKDFLAFSLAGEHFQLSLSNQENRRNAVKTIKDTMKALSAENVDDMLNQIAEATGETLPATPPDDFRPMTWDMARKYESKGIHFAPHTVSHRILSKLNADSAENEIVNSWKRIKEELTSPSPVFCYPTGRYCDYGPREIDILKKAGFIGAVSTYPAQVERVKKSTKYLYQLPRFGFPSTLEEFIHDVSWLGYARNRPDRSYDSYF